MTPGPGFPPPTWQWPMQPRTPPDAYMRMHAPHAGLSGTVVRTIAYPWHTTPGTPPPAFLPPPGVLMHPTEVDRLKGKVEELSAKVDELTAKVDIISNPYAKNPVLQKSSDIENTIQ